MEHRRDVWNVGSQHLPPRELWLFTPGKDELIPTPLDERGLVDVDALMETVESTVHPEFTWESSKKPNAHHLYWEHNRYPNSPDASVNPEVFCNLPINQIVIPRKIHAWIHHITEEPPVPSEEVMGYRIETYRVINKLLSEAELSDKLARRPYITEERFNRGSERHLWQFLVEIEKAQSIPPEFQLINFSELSPDTNEDLHGLITFLRGAIGKARLVPKAA